MTTSPALDLNLQLDDEHRAVLDTMPMRMDLADIEAARAGMAERRAAMPAAPMPDNVAMEDHMAPGPEGAPDVMVRTYRPAGLPTNAPAFYWIHGGGMVLGNVEMSDPYCAGIADTLNVLVASVEYRLAPEYPFPAPIEDCYAGLKWFA